MAGEPAPPRDKLYPPSDNLVLGPNPAPDDLTITWAVGASLFDDRYGLAAQRAEAARGHAEVPERRPRAGPHPRRPARPDLRPASRDLRPRPAPADAGQPSVRSRLRWMMNGFVEPNTLGPGRASGRNLLGFKDGTANPDAGDAAIAQDLVWVDPADGRAGVGDGRQLHGGADHPQPGRVLGPHRPADARDDHRPLQGHRRAARRPVRGRHPWLRRRPGGRGDAAHRPHPPGQPQDARDREEPHPAPGLQLLERLHGRRPARPGPAVRLLPAEPGAGLRRGPDPAQRRGPRGVHQADRRRLLLRPARRRPRRLAGARAAAHDRTTPGTEPSCPAPA